MINQNHRQLRQAMSGDLNRRWKQPLATVVFSTLFIISLLQGNVSAGEPKAKSVEDLSKEIANPLAQIWNLSFQYNYSTIEGDLVDGSEELQTGLFQPVLPVPLGDKYTLFARPVITVIDGPNGVGITGGTPADPIGQGLEKSTELGDIILPIGIGIVQKTGWSGGLGVTFIFPTSNNDLLGSHQYQAGPTALALWGNKNWLVGGHLQHWWGISDDGDSDDNPIVRAAHNKDLNHTNLQYFIVRHLPNAWQLRTSPNISINWEADSDNKLTLPIGIGIGKMFKIGPMPVMLMAEYQYSIIAPDDIGKESTIMLQANFIIKNPFGDL